MHHSVFFLLSSVFLQHQGLLLILLSNRGKVLSRTALLENIWDVAGDFVEDNTLTVYIKRLRDKIEEDPAKPEFIKTIRGFGYVIEK